MPPANSDRQGGTGQQERRQGTPPCHHGAVAAGGRVSHGNPANPWWVGCSPASQPASQPMPSDMPVGACIRPCPVCPEAIR